MCRRLSPQPEIEAHRNHASQDSQDLEQDVNLVDDLRQPENTGPEIVPEKNQQRDEDQRTQEVVEKELPEIDPHGPGGKKRRDPESGDKAGDEYGFIPVIPVELPASLHALLGQDLAQMMVVEEILTPFLPDGVNGQIAPQDPEEADGQHGVETDDAQADEESPAEQGQFFRDGQAQSAEKEDQEEPCVNERLGITEEEKGFVRQGFCGSRLGLTSSRGGFGEVRGWR